jgi:putative restriction endonuclease
MAKAVFTTRVTPSYNDLPEVRYHFPSTYLNQARQSVGDHIVYYEPRRTSADLSSSGGRQAYFGVARVTAVVEDAALAGHHYAFVDDYLDFDRPVPFSEGGEYYESALKKEDGSTNRGAFGRAVRLIPDDEFDRILKSGFAPILRENLEQQAASPFDISEPLVPFERPIVEMTVSRPFRERSFMHNVRAAYSNRCAITGLRLINGTSPAARSPNAHFLKSRSFRPMRGARKNSARWLRRQRTSGHRPARRAPRASPAWPGSACE